MMMSKNQYTAIQRYNLKQNESTIISARWPKKLTQVQQIANLRRDLSGNVLIVE